MAENSAPRAKKRKILLTAGHDETTRKLTSKNIEYTTMAESRSTSVLSWPESKPRPAQIAPITNSQVIANLGVLPKALRPLLREPNKARPNPPKTTSVTNIGAPGTPMYAKSLV